ncbi:hypothetical protein [Actinokineospora iranica]|uniref:Circularly permuted type 2 ATP-grasp protein n=1 Tax=Actinokineospora iranica TaxID=1271860 RepID=A0A1G6QWL3_9PSEU|nr:hypothetical protein [Actinokineospora iranica]SDC96819.1 hypothetical protein SAMN05216174_10611 [Actinokineospora iranica]
MIDWVRAGRCAAALAQRPERAAKALVEATGAARCFQNTEFPLSPLPVFAKSTAVAEVVPALERYVALLARIVRLHREVPEVRDWYGLGPAADTLIDADRGMGDAVAVCRLDGYLEQGTERLRLLENNADAPAGTLFTPRINHIVRDAVTRAGVAAPEWTPPTFADETALLDVLLAGGGSRVAILQFAGRVTAESQEMAHRFRLAGAEVFVADPRAVRVRGGRTYFGTEQADACWNKVNTAGWRSAVESDPDLVRAWAAAVSSGNLRHVNPFGARYVAESKFTLGLARDPRFAGLFDADEHALVDRLVPWSVRLAPGARTEDGDRPLTDDLLDNPADYVLKEPYDIRGDGVTVGRATRRAQWRAAVERALRDRMLVQRHVPPAAYPVVRAGQDPMVAAMPISFDTYLFGGRVGGFGAKASFQARVNVFRGGRKLAVHVVAPPAEPAAE